MKAVHHARPTPSQNGRSVSTKLTTLEAGRFFAALLVVLYHYTSLVKDFTAATVFGDAFRPGHLGVPYFFVLSGFIIYFVHRQDIGQPGTIVPFIRKRAIRLFPMFWAVTAAMLVGFLAIPALSGERSISVLGLAADLLLLPHADAVLAVSWTLRHELVFYALFLLVLRFGHRGLWPIAGWIVISLIGAAYNLDAGELGGWSLIGSTHNLGFGLGIFCAVLVARNPGGDGRLALWTGGSALAALYALEWALERGLPHDADRMGMAGHIAYLVAAAVLIYGLVKTEAGWRVPGAALWRTLGGASYLLYLVHQPVGSLAVRVLPIGAWAPEATFLTITAIAVASAVAGHLLLERPLLKALSKGPHLVRRRLAPEVARSLGSSPPLSRPPDHGRPAS